MKSLKRLSRGTPGLVPRASPASPGPVGNARRSGVDTETCDLPSSLDDHEVISVQWTTVQQRCRHTVGSRRRACSGILLGLSTDGSWKEGPQKTVGDRCLSWEYVQSIWGTERRLMWLENSYQGGGCCCWWVGLACTYTYPEVLLAGRLVGVWGWESAL